LLLLAKPDFYKPGRKAWLQFLSGKTKWQQMFIHFFTEWAGVSGFLALLENNFLLKYKCDLVELDGGYVENHAYVCIIFPLGLRYKNKVE